VVYTDPKNKNSENVLVLNGFVQDGTALYDGEENKFWIKKL
jgi:hypothetical protein